MFIFVVPISPRETIKVPDVILESFIDVKLESFTNNVTVVILKAFIEVKPEPEPTKIVADKILVVLFNVRFADCKIDVPILFGLVIKFFNCSFS